MLSLAGPDGREDRSAEDPSAEDPGERPGLTFGAGYYEVVCQEAAYLF